MTYDAPELLLIGAAQNLVMDQSGPSFNPDCKVKDSTASGFDSDIVEIW